MLRMLVALGLALHGLIHLIGFVVPFRLAQVEAYSHTTSAAWGHLELGEGRAHVVGVLWLLATAAFLVAAYGIWQHRPCASDASPGRLGLATMRNVRTSLTLAMQWPPDVSTGG